MEDKQKNKLEKFVKKLNLKKIINAR